MPALTRRNNPAELRAFELTCQRLGGFDTALSFESVDGFLTALAAGPRVPPVEQWLAALCGDAFDRAFADPADRAQALRSLKTRLAVLLDQLDAEALLDGPDEVRLEPLMAEWDDGERERLLQAGEISADEAAALQVGAEWARGFRRAVESFGELWPGAAAPLDVAGSSADDDPAVLYAQLLERVAVLTWPAGDARLLAHLTVAEGSPPVPVVRDDLITAACFAIQDLRLWWVDHVTPPPTRRVEPTPGRNEPCPCGSGKKFKKCHGAAGTVAGAPQA